MDGFVLSVGFVIQSGELRLAVFGRRLLVVSVFNAAILGLSSPAL